MSIEQIKDLYEALKRAEKRLDAANEEQKNAKTDFDRLSKDLGDLLFVLDMSKVTMSDNKTIGIKTTYFASAAQERIPQIQEYLESINNAGILKPKKLNITAADIEDLPDNLKDSVVYEINSNTLKAFINELGRKGEITDEVMKLFAVYQENKVIIE